MVKKTAKAARNATKRRTRTSKKEEIRGRILSSALALFQAKGFDATTTKAIARRARIAEGTVFNYFPTKEDIALYFFAQEVDHAISAVRGNARLRKARLDEKLFALVQTQLDFLGPHERFIGAAFVQALKPGSKLGVFSVPAHSLKGRYLSYVQELLDESIRQGEISAAGWWTPHLFWIYYLGVLLYWLQDETPGKQQTLAFLDRSLKIGISLLKED